MAVNKRKVLDAARKYAQKGAKEKALKEYHTLLKLDPRDAKLHLEIGDCYRRWGQIEEAITQYSRVADQYKDDGFDARSVAVFKQILNLDPKRYTAHVSLAELYQRMGLDAEALASLQAAADGYHKEGNKPAALDLLRKMATLDPTNTTSRLKVAELLRQEGMDDDAVSEYEAVVAEFDRQSVPEQTIPVLERILELRPDRVDVMLQLAQKLVGVRTPERAEPFARKAADHDPDNSDAHEVLCEIYKALGKEDALAKQTRLLAHIYSERGDEDKAREIAQRVPLSMDFAADDPGVAPASDHTESAFLGDDELLDDDEFLAPNAGGPTAAEELPLQDGEELELELDDEADGDDFDLGGDGDEPPVVDEAESEAPMPEGDPDQLLAEASVYLRYGKRDQAVASLKAVLEQEPDNRLALEKLGDAYAESDRSVEAVAMWQRAARRASADGDADGFGVLRDRIAALDAEAADALQEELGGSSSDADDRAGLDDDFEIDVAVDDDGPAESDDGEDGFEIDVSADGPEVNEADDDGPSIEVDADIDFEIDVDADEEDASPEVAAAEAGDPAAASGPGGSSTGSQQVAEDLEEAEFYFGQDMFDEAEAIYRRVLQVAPNHPSALLRLGELAARKGGDGAASPTETAQPAAAGAPVSEEPDFEIDVSADGKIVAPGETGEDSTEVAELGLDEDDDEPAVQMDLPRAPAGPSRADVTIPFDQSEEPDLGPDPEDGSFSLDLDDDEEDDTEQEIAAASAVEPAPEPVAAADAGAEGGGFDLAAELRDVIEDDEEDDASDRDRSTVEDGFESIFADFKQGVSQTLSEDDYETRYDLGIAYREMELYEDAIGEFRMCLESPTCKLASLHMMGLCALDLGRAQDAVNHLEQALSTADLPQGQVGALQLDLGRALEGAGDAERARSAYEAALAADPELPGIRERIEALESGGSAPPVGDASDGDFESFDDLMSETGDDDDTTEQTESFESFDDVITEAERGGAAEPIEDAAEAEVVLEAEPEDEPDADGPKKKRKKKISFV